MYAIADVSSQWNNFYAGSATSLQRDNHTGGALCTGATALVGASGNYRSWQEPVVVSTRVASWTQELGRMQLSWAGPVASKRSLLVSRPRRRGVDRQ